MIVATDRRLVLGMTSPHLELLRRLTISDEKALNRVMSGSVERVMLDERTSALIGIAALLATDAAEASYQSAVETARAAGVDDDEILQVALALAPIIGLARTGVAVPHLLASLGYEVDTADDPR
jgi:alkylhydroperoxidase/carboxymuconolactone decarboxylase family protein YurZ